jgi:hypothetical protein
MHGTSRWSSGTVAVLALITLTSCTNDATSPASTPAPGFAAVTTGNGAPSGEHYNLNIIGVKEPKSEDMDAAGGNVIFMLLGSKNTPVRGKILLEQSAQAGVFAVLDKNGTDGEASFSLPAPGGYSVWARALAKPGGESTMTTCATDITGEVVEGDICSTQNEVFVRGTGRSSFRNVTPALTTITLDAVQDAAAIEACGATTVSLFDGCLEGYFWQYDNRGLKLLQLRFYLND